MSKKSKTFLLGIESSASTCAVGLAEGGTFLNEMSVSGKYIHSQSLAPFVERVLKEANIAASDLSAIVLSAGPGSFTGLRIGYSLAKGLAHASGSALIEVPTLDVWAHQFRGQTAHPVMPVIDAHRDELFYALYSPGEGFMQRESEYALGAIAGLPGILRGKTLVVGEISESLKSEIINAAPGKVVFPSAEKPQLSVQALLELGYLKFTAGEFSDLENCEPFYMRKFKGVS